MIDLKAKVFSKTPKNNKFYIIAIDGRGGAGKTTLAEYISKLLANFTMINGDEYFEHDDNTIALGSFNDARFIKDVIKPLKDDKTDFTYYPYDWHKTPHIQEKQLRITKGLIFERSFSLNFNLDWDLIIWVETPKRLALERGQERDEMLLELGYRSWKYVWQPQEDAHIKKLNHLRQPI